MPQRRSGVEKVAHLGGRYRIKVASEQVWTVASDGTIRDRGLCNGYVNVPRLVNPPTPEAAQAALEQRGASYVRIVVWATGERGFVGTHTDRKSINVRVKLESHNQALAVIETLALPNMTEALELCIRSKYEEVCSGTHPDPSPAITAAIDDDLH